MIALDFHTYKTRFIAASRQIWQEHENRDALAESAFPAYAHSNPLASYLFWSRVRISADFVQQHGPFDHSLDFGCGGGVMLQSLSQQSNKVTAFDIDFTALDEMERHIQTPANVRRALNLDDESQFGASSLDLIVALDVLEHVDDLPELLQKFARMLRPGGKLLVSGPTENVLYRIGRRLAGREFTGHYHVRSIYDIHDCMTECFHVETLATLYYPFPLFKIYSATPRG